jgi:hypothetical protein
MIFSGVAFKKHVVFYLRRSVTPGRCPYNDDKCSIDDELQTNDLEFWLTALSTLKNFEDEVIFTTHDLRNLKV